MDLRAFGTGPRTWSRRKPRTTSDNLFIGFALALLVVSVAWAFSGNGQFSVFWIP